MATRLQPFGGEEYDDVISNCLFSNWMHMPGHVVLSYLKSVGKHGVSSGKINIIARCGAGEDF